MGAETLAIVKGAGEVAKPVTDILGLWLNYKGLKVQEEQNNRLTALTLSENEKGRQLQYGRLGLERKQQRFQEQSEKWAQKYKEDERKYSRYWDFVNSLYKSAASNMDFRTKLIDMQKARVLK